MTTMSRTRRLPLVLALIVLAHAGCGGNGDDDSGSNGSSDNPAETILTDAGLDVCSQSEEQIAQSTVGPGLLAARAFAVAEDCGGSETSPNTIRVFQFGNREAVDQGAESATDAYPRGVVLVSGALVIVVTGPDREANADAVGTAYEDSTGEPVRTV
jgi:hypothetical protein